MRRLIVWKLFSLMIKIVSTAEPLNAAFKAARARNRPLGRYLLPLRRSDRCRCRESGDVTLARLPKFNAPSAFGGSARRKSPSWRRVSVSSCYAPTASHFPLSSHLDSATFIPWRFRHRRASFVSSYSFSFRFVSPTFYQLKEYA